MIEVMSSLPLPLLCNCQLFGIWCCFSFCVASKSDFSWVFFLFLNVLTKKKRLATLKPPFFTFQQKPFSLYSNDKEKGCPGESGAAASRVAAIHLQGGAPVLYLESWELNPSDQQMSFKVKVCMLAGGRWTELSTASKMEPLTNPPSSSEGNRPGQGARFPCQAAPQ